LREWAFLVAYALLGAWVIGSNILFVAFLAALIVGLLGVELACIKRPRHPEAGGGSRSVACA
jgi:hypothetical protein